MDFFGKGRSDRQCRGNLQFFYVFVLAHELTAQLCRSCSTREGRHWIFACQEEFLSCLWRYCPFPVISHTESWLICIEKCWSVADTAKQYRRFIARTYAQVHLAVSWTFPKCGIARLLNLHLITMRLFVNAKAKGFQSKGHQKKRFIFVVWPSSSIKIIQYTVEMRRALEFPVRESHLTHYKRHRRQEKQHKKRPKQLFSCSRKWRNDWSRRERRLHQALLLTLPPSHPPQEWKLFINVSR